MLDDLPDNTLQHVVLLLGLDGAMSAAATSSRIAAVVARCVEHGSWQILFGGEVLDHVNIWYDSWHVLLQQHEHGYTIWSVTHNLTFVALGVWCYPARAEWWGAAHELCSLRWSDKYMTEHLNMVVVFDRVLAVYHCDGRLLQVQPLPALLRGRKCSCHDSHVLVCCVCESVGELDDDEVWMVRVAITA